MLTKLGTLIYGCHNIVNFSKLFIVQFCGRLRIIESLRGHFLFTVTLHLLNGTISVVYLFVYSRHLSAI